MGQLRVDELVVEGWRLAESAAAVVRRMQEMYEAMKRAILRGEDTDADALLRC